MRKVKPGETIYPGDLVAIDANGEIVKAHLNDQVVGVVVNEPKLGFVVKPMSHDGYMGVEGKVIQLTDGIKRSDELRVERLVSASKLDPNLASIFKARMTEHIIARVEASNLPDIIANKIQEAVERNLLQASPNKIPSITTRVSKTGVIDIESTVPDIKINFDKKGKGMIWIGLLCDNGKEVSANEYSRQAVELDIDGTTSDITFPAALSDWGQIVSMAVYNRPDASSPMVVKDINYGHPVRPSLGHRVNLAKISVQTMPMPYDNEVETTAEELTVTDSDKESLKLKAETARRALEGVFK